MSPRPQHLLFIASPGRLFVLALALAATAVALCGCARPTTASAAPAVAPVVLDYWEKWTGFEAEAMRALVDDFNASQSRIRVRYLPVSQIERKLLLATAGGNPPDLAGIYAYLLPVYAENNALTPLDSLARRAGLHGADYLPFVWAACRHQGFLWALPTTPAVTALHWNKKAFREAGLDPERPPRTLAELEAFNDKLLVRDADGRLLRLGHSPQEPGWWNAYWVACFGGALWDPAAGFRADGPEMQAAFRWAGSYPRRFGAHELQRLRNGFGSFASPQNPFFTGRVAMVMQGPWMFNFIRDFAPADFEWGVAPFPSAVPGSPGFAIAESDVLVIPAGARHPAEAFTFMAYVNRPENLERLCLAQKKLSPLRAVSADFYTKHSNPYIRDFAAIAASEGLVSFPPVTVWSEYQDALNNAFDLMCLGDRDALDLLAPLQARLREQELRKQARWERVRATRLEEWKRHDQN